MTETTKADHLTRDALMALLSYEPETGLFRWKVRRRSAGGCVNPGDVAGTTDKYGYRRVRVSGYSYAAHQLAWLFTHAVWPAEDIDHINCEKSDNRIANLRVVSRSVNKQNRKTAQRNARTGLLGAYAHQASRKYRAAITDAGKQKHLGMFDTPEAAHAAYVAAKRQIHEGCTI